MAHTQPAVFWDWFLRNQPRLETAIAAAKAGRFDVVMLVDGIREAMWVAGFDLAHEIGQKESGEFHFIISADGKREKIPAVLELHRAAPRIENWDVTAFRPSLDLSTKILISPSESIAIESLYFLVEETSDYTAVVLVFDDPLAAKVNLTELNFLARRSVEALLGEYRTLNDIDFVYGSPMLPDIDRAFLRPIGQLESTLREMDGHLPS